MSLDARPPFCLYICLVVHIGGKLIRYHEQVQRYVNREMLYGPYILSFIPNCQIRDTKGTFHAKTGTIKDRNGTDLTEAEGIKKRWQEYTKELIQKNIFMTQITTMV